MMQRHFQLNLERVVVVGAGWIGVGTGDRLIVFDGVGECEFNCGAGDGNRGDGISGAIGCDRKVG